MKLQRDPQRNGAALSRALADKTDIRKAKRFANRMRAECRTSKGAHGGSNAMQVAKTQRMILAVVAGRNMSPGHLVNVTKALSA